MREKLVFILRNPLLTLDDRTGQILSLLKEGIKKVENPYKDRPQHRVTYRRLEDFRQKILRALEEK
jgi:hypothetical protein